MTGFDTNGGSGWKAALHLDLDTSLRRILGLCCRNRANAGACGSFDRTWWAWRSKDMPNASLQYGVYPLALAWRFMPSPWKDSPVLRDAILDGLKFWCSIQHRAGSYSQLMPNEHSVGTTFYTLGAVLETVRLLGGAVPADLAERVGEAASRAGAFLLHHRERYGVVANHIALFAWVFHVLGRETGEDRYKRAARAEEGRLLDAYNASEGWFLEYDGADPGYQTQCLSYMFRMASEFGRERMGEVAAESFDRFLKYFFHPDGTFGGVYGSRATSVVYPGALFGLARQHGIAASAAAWFARSLESGAMARPSDMDDENVIRLAAAYLHTFGELGLDVPGEAASLLPCEMEHTQVSFPIAGLEVVSGAGRYTVISLKKGGSFYTCGASGASESDAGYVAVLGEDGSAATQLLQQPQVERLENGFRVRSRFLSVPARVTTPLNILALRLMNLTVMRLPRVGDLVKALLVRLLITNRSETGMTLDRHVSFSGAGLVVEDTVRMPKGKRPTALFFTRGNVLTMASADYCKVGELGLETHVALPAHAWADTGAVFRKREIRE